MDAAEGLPARMRQAGFPTPRRPRDAPRRPRELVVVGVDGSASSVAALAWAMEHAVQRHCGLLVLTAWPLGRRPFVHEVPGHFNEARWEAQEAQDRSIARARSLVEAVPEVETVLRNAPARDALVEATGLGRLVVLGTDRGEEEQLPTRAASLTLQVQQGAACPVVLVPRKASRPGPGTGPAGSVLPKGFEPSLPT